MVKLLLFWCLLLVSLIFHHPVYAVEGTSFVSVVNPLRGLDFWESGEKPEEGVRGQMEIVKKLSIPATWLIRYDALKEFSMIELLKSTPEEDEKGLFLEITPSWTEAANVRYRSSLVWHWAESVFLTGYEQEERIRLIDAAFGRFKEVFGFYPRSVGAWWIDSYSLEYMQKKYQITAALIVADQYSTDNYQIWGQYWSTPYYPARDNALRPAQNLDEKLPVVVVQWAARDPVNGYGKGVEESTYSVQANDYLDYHKIGTDYFSSLVDVYTKQKFNQFGHLVVGLENSYSWSKYKGEYQKQIETLLKKSRQGQFTFATLAGFSQWYLKKFPETSPPHLLIADDPLGTSKKSVWFMNNYYRLGWFYTEEGSIVRDVRQYIAGQEELCRQKGCEQLNFATFATRVLDDVTYQQRLLLDRGKIEDFQIKKDQEKVIITYKNEAGRGRVVGLLPRDISLDGKISSIDGLILDTIGKREDLGQKEVSLADSRFQFYKESIWGLAVKIIKFGAFVLLALFVPGFVWVSNLRLPSPTIKIFLSVSSGMVGLTLVSLVAGYLKFWWLIIFYLLGSGGLFISKKLYQQLKVAKIKFLFERKMLLIVVVIGMGTFFQSWGMIRSGWVYNFGIGFWGPSGHDGIWHQALINQLVKQVPPQNPAFSETALSGYHYFYNLLVATTSTLSQLPVVDLLYRFYPILLSTLLGVGTYLLVMRLIGNFLAVFLSLYFVYFGSSFGWVVEYFKRGSFWGGESNFWVNQPVSMNLNPPFAISLILLISILLIFREFLKKPSFLGGLLLVLIVGTLVEFKAYGGVIVLGGLAVVALQGLVFKKDMSILQVFLGSLILSLGLFLPHNKGSVSLLIFSPFWFVHSMIDSADRVGWVKLSSSRVAYLGRGEWIKFILAEALALVLFVVGNLGTRFVALFTLTSLIKKKIWQDLNWSLIFWMSIISIIVPILFIQKGNAWNTIQFFYYFLYFTTVLVGGVWLFLHQYLPKVIFWPLLIVILIITPLSSIPTFRESLSRYPPSYLSFSEFEALKFLKNQPEGTVLTYPYSKRLKGQFNAPYQLNVYETSSYVSAFSSHPTFIEDEIQQEILQTDYKKRLVGAHDFFRIKDPVWSRQFLQENNISYIYLPKVFRVYLEPDKLKVKRIFENGETEVYQVLN